MCINRLTGKGRYEMGCLSSADVMSLIVCRGINGSFIDRRDKVKEGRTEVMTTSPAGPYIGKMRRKKMLSVNYFFISSSSLYIPFPTIFSNTILVALLGGCDGREY